MLKYLTAAALLAVPSDAQRIKDPLKSQANYKDDNGSEFDFHWFEKQKLDHFDPIGTKTFKERYWINDKYFNDNDEDAPIFLYICGEWTCNPPQVDKSSAFTLGAKLGARLVVHEHRYYGESQPFTDA
jgi:hypothetical protein